MVAESMSLLLCAATNSGDERRFYVAKALSGARVTYDTRTGEVDASELMEATVGGDHHRARLRTTAHRLDE